MRATVPTLLLSLSLSAISISAGQTSPPQPATQLPAEADPGVRPFRLMDRDEIRVTRVELQPGAVRRVHVHDDVEYHVWTPVTGTLEITIGNDAPKAAAKPSLALPV
jgi:quercetin dioxygenase-like cupin family protein